MAQATLVNYPEVSLLHWAGGISGPLAPLEQLRIEFSRDVNTEFVTQALKANARRGQRVGDTGPTDVTLSLTWESPRALLIAIEDLVNASVSMHIKELDGFS